QRSCFFYAFDVLSYNDEDLRDLPLLARKARLRALVPSNTGRLLYLDHLEERGVALFERVCALDLEGIVAKRKTSKYRATEQRSRDWIKIKNQHYTQAEERHELFEGLRDYSKNASTLRRG